MAKPITDTWLCLDAQAIYDHRCALSYVLRAHRSAVFDKIGARAFPLGIDKWCEMMIACDEIEPDPHDSLTRLVAFRASEN